MKKANTFESIRMPREQPRHCVHHDLIVGGARSMDARETWCQETNWGKLTRPYQPIPILEPTQCFIKAADAMKMFSVNAEGRTWA